MTALQGLLAQFRDMTRGEKSKVIYNSKITIENIPEEAYDYVVNGKPPAGDAHQDHPYFDR